MLKLFLTKQQKINRVQQQFEKGLFGRLEREDVTKLVNTLRLDKESVREAAVKSFEKRVERGQARVITDIGEWVELDKVTTQAFVKRAE